MAPYQKYNMYVLIDEERTERKSRKSIRELREVKIT